MNNTELPDIFHPLARRAEASDWTPPTPVTAEKGWCVIDINGRLYPMSTNEYAVHVKGQVPHTVARVLVIDVQGDIIEATD